MRIHLSVTPPNIPKPSNINLKPNQIPPKVIDIVLVMVDNDLVSDYFSLALHVFDLALGSILLALRAFE